MSWSMIDMPGNFAVVIHGEFDCVNCFHHQQGQSAIQYYSTRLTEAQLTTGRTEEPLRRCLELIVQHQQPDGVIVLGTCPVEVIGDQFQVVVQDVAKATGVPMLPLRTNGLKLGTQAAMLDWLCDSLARFAVEVPGECRDRLNLIGFPGGAKVFAEPRELLQRVGITVNGVYPHAAGFDCWRNIANASLNAVVDSGMYPKLMRRLRDRDQAIINVPFPVGLEATRSFYTLLIESLHGEGAAQELVAGYTERLSREVDRFRSDFKGIKFAYAVRMKNTYSIANVAYDGLGFLSALLELGFEVELLIQGAPDADAQQAYAKRLEQRGVSLPFHVFSSPPEVIDILRNGGYRLTYLSDSSHSEARQAGVVAFGERTFHPFFSGVPKTILGLRRLLRTVR
jgi:nitrogenase molybdenum-iron protein alpha/beta subunit